MVNSNKYGNNLKFILEELANSELDQIEFGEIEIMGEDGSGVGGHFHTTNTRGGRSGLD